MSAVRRAFLVLLLALGSAAPAAAADWGSIERLLGGARFAGPDGWRRLCWREPGYCAAGAGQAASTGTARPVALDGRASTLLAEVNQAVNAAILAENEPVGEDVWRVAPQAGDCDDYALTKRAVLRGRGWPDASLRFATAFTEADEYHLVLLVETTRGTLVLDNRFERPMPWTRLSALGYRWIAVEGFERRDWGLASGALEVLRHRAVIPAAP